MQNQVGAGEGLDDFMEGIALADYPVREHSKKKIKDAGKLLSSGNLQYTDEVALAFRIAHNWRMAHAFPMLQERRSLSRVSGPDADTAGRIKRMDSIRKKLRRIPISLSDIQDLSGIRAIVDSMSEVRRIEAWYMDPKRTSVVRRVDDYIAAPKPGGYRSLHLIKGYGGSGESWRGQTRLQHVWATAVEAIGATRGEDLKAGEGDEGWLRLLCLMSSEFAEEEGEPVGEDTPQSAEDRRKELKSLEGRLGAINTLSAIRTMVSNVTSSATAYMVHLDTISGKVTVQPKKNYIDASEGYYQQSQADNGERVQTVLVSVDSIEALKRAYPNYFLDVGEFTRRLIDACAGRGKSRRNEPDTSFLKTWDQIRRGR